MAQPPPYDRSYNFHDYQAENPLKPLPADKLDEEFSRVKTTIDAVLQNLALIQRDDTALANKSVGYDQLKDEIQLGFNPPTDWTANHNYVTRDTVFVDVSIYRCLVSHISSNDFEDDLNAGYWELVVDFASVQTAAIAARDAALQAQADAEAAQQAAEDARDDALLAQSGAESARDAAIGAKNDAVAAKTASESARDASVAAKGLAEAAQAGAEAAQQAAEDARDDAIAAKNLAEGFKDDAEAALDDFNGRYLGAHAAAPVGTLAGQLYFNTTTNLMMVYDGASWVQVTSGADMVASVYDPNGVAGDAFDMDNMVEGASNKILTAALKSKLDGIEDGAQVNLPVGTTAGTVAAGNDYRFYPASATIKHVRVNPNLIYDVIEVKNNRLNTVRKEFAPGVSPDGAVTRIPARLFAKQTGAKIVINADGWRNADGTDGWDKPLARPVGLQIANGTLYQDWAPGELFPQAIVMMDDGFLVEANASDGISGAQWVANGAQWSIGWGAVCVRNGAAVNLDSSHMDQIRSARTLLGQRANGEIVIVLVEGVSGSYGPLPNECGPLMVSMGCQIAFICDGGGSSQCWWKNTYALPSSDKNAESLPAERGVPTFIVIDPETYIEEYDSGVIPLATIPNVSGMSGKHPLTVRHIGTNIRVTLAAHIAPEILPDDQYWITDNGGFPTRYMQDQDGPSRIWISGNGGRPAGAYVSGPLGRMSMEQHTDMAFTYIAGSGSWPAPFTNLADE